MRLPSQPVEAEPKQLQVAGAPGEGPSQAVMLLKSSAAAPSVKIKMLLQSLLCAYSHRGAWQGRNLQEG